MVGYNGFSNKMLCYSPHETRAADDPREIAMFTQIIKRDGRQVPYVPEKIADAIFKAFVASNSAKGYDEACLLARHVAETLARDESIGVPTVEQIQDGVEKALIESGYVRTARAFIVYRSERTRAREMNTRLMKIYEEITFKPAADSDIKRENANIDGDTAMGTMLKYGSEGAKQFYEMFVLKPDHAAAHINGDIHIHDMDFLTLTTTCCQIDLMKMFKGGFSTGHGVLREPNDIASYSALACIAIQANQNDQHGGQSVHNFDYGMACGVEKTYIRLYRSNLRKFIGLLGRFEPDDETLKTLCADIRARTGHYPKLAGDPEYETIEAEALLRMECTPDIIERAQAFARDIAARETDRACYQAMEAFIHNLNTMHSRAGAQTPFSSINYGMDTSPEGRMVIKNVLLATQAGLGNGETPVFPIQIFRVKEGISFDPQDPNYDLFRLACATSAKRLFPNFAFQDAPFNLKYYKPEDPNTEIAYMGCRTRVMGNVFDPTQEVTGGRGNLSFTSINLPRIAIKANRDISFFFEELDRKIALCVAQLLERFEIQCQKTVKNFPFLMGEGVWIGSENLKRSDSIREVLKHGTLTVGFIGLAEALVALIGAHHGESQQAQNLGLEIVGFMRKRMDEEAEKFKLNFSLIATPAEGLSGRFVRMDKKMYGAIPGVTDRDYYTNSFHIPVHFGISAFDKINLEAPYHALTNAGHITYVEMDGDPTQNLEAFEQVIRAMKHAGIGYGAINHPVDRDPECGFTGIINDTCPGCGRDSQEGIERIRRVTGYLAGTLENFNNAKRAEERDRVKHGLSSATGN